MSTTSGGSVVRREIARDFEALDVGQADVQQDQVRAERARGCQSRCAVIRLADDA